ncbi:MAG: hypothetical protein GY796_30905 [Chloroflexi bacterium]|nr:hypothetical protein [Chloroflexota bacterium]
MIVTNIFIPGLILLALVTAVYTVSHNWRQHQERSQQAQLRGWRYAASDWRYFLKPHFQLAGTTPTGKIWEMNQRWQNGRLLFVWQTKSTRLPYGIIKILPSQFKLESAPSQFPMKLHLLQPFVKDWPDTLQIFTSHDQLAHTFFGPAIIKKLYPFPVWPERGSLQGLVWQQNTLLIVGHFENGWEVLDRIVALGTALIEGPDSNQPVGEGIVKQEQQATICTIERSHHERDYSA